MDASAVPCAHCIVRVPGVDPTVMMPSGCPTVETPVPPIVAVDPTVWLVAWIDPLGEVVVGTGESVVQSIVVPAGTDHLTLMSAVVVAL